jgi:hypothetical protein
VNVSSPAARLFLLVFAAYSYFYQGGGWSPNSRFDLTRAIVERGTIAIDAFHENTGDKAERDGHYYCDKAPGVSWLAVPPYAFVHALSPNAVELGAYVATVVAVALPSALAVIVLFSIARSFALDAAWSAAISLAYALGTLMWPYATLLQGHALAASAGLAAFALVRSRRPTLAGLCLGAAVCIEYTSAVLVLVIGVYAFARLGARGAARLAAGGLPAALALAAYHAAAFGHPLALPYDFVLQEHRHQGWFMGIAAPDAGVLGELLFGAYRGLFYSAPWLLAALPGLFFLARRQRSDAAVCGSVFAAYLFLNAGLVDWHGAWAMGPRYLIPALPFLAVAVAALVAAWPAGSVVRRALAVAGAMAVAFSVAMMLVGTAVKPEVPLDVRRPFADFLLPKFLHGNLARNTQSIDSAGGTNERQAWNLGHKLGLDGLWTLLPLGAWVVLTGAALFQAARAADRRVTP